MEGVLAPPKFAPLLPLRRRPTMRSWFDDVVQLKAETRRPTIVRDENPTFSTGTLPALVMTRLFYGIASLDAFDHLREACLITLTKQDPLDRYLDGPKIVLALRRFGETNYLTSILSRLHLTRLVDLRNNKRRHYEDQVPVRRTQKTNTEEGYGRASSLAMAELIAECYPRLTP
jgi:hypothetical protein